MLGRKNFTREEIDHGKAAVDEQLAEYPAAFFAELERKFL